MSAEQQGTQFPFATRFSHEIARLQQAAQYGYKIPFLEENLAKAKELQIEFAGRGHIVAPEGTAFVCELRPEDIIRFKGPKSSKIEHDIPFRTLQAINNSAGSLIVANEISALIGDEQASTCPESDKRFSLAMRGLARNALATSVSPTHPELVGGNYTLLAEDTMLVDHRVTFIDLANAPDERTWL